LRIIKFCFRINSWILVGRIARGFVTRHLALVYEMATTLILSGQETKEITDNLPLKKNVVSKIQEELTSELLKAQTYINDLSESFPEIIKSIHTKRSAMFLLEYQKKFLTNYRNKGYIDEADYLFLRQDLDLKFIKLENMTFKWEAPSFQWFIMEFPIFVTLTPEEL